MKSAATTSVDMATASCDPPANANHGGDDLIVYAYGTPPASEHAEILDSAV